MKSYRSIEYSYKKNLQQMFGKQKNGLSKNNMFGIKYNWYNKNKIVSHRSS